MPNQLPNLNQQINMTLKNIGLTKISLATVIIIICVVAAAVAVYWLQTEESSELLPIPIILKPANETANWQTYRNEEMGIEFKYPSIYEYETMVIDTKDAEQGVFCPGCRGKKIEILFYPKDNKENLSFDFTVATQDYALFLDRHFFSGHSNLNSLCPKENELFNDSACRIIEINEVKAIFKSSYWLGSSGFPYSVATEILFNNESDSIYKGLRFFLDLDVYNNLRKKWEHWTVEAPREEWEKAHLEALFQIENIIKNQNLSDRDFNLLKIINQILSTFKFIK